MSSDSIETRGKKCAGLLLKSALLIAVIAVLGYGVSRTGRRERHVETYRVQRGPLTVAVIAGGNARSLAPHRIQVNVHGDYVKVLSLAEEGRMITKEDIENRLVLAELDSAQLEQRIMDYEIYYEMALAGYARARETLDVMDKENESLILGAERGVKFNAMDLRKYLGEALANELIAKVTVERTVESAVEGYQQAIQDAAQAQAAAEAAADALVAAQEAAGEEGGAPPVVLLNVLEEISSKGKQEKLPGSDLGDEGAGEEKFPKQERQANPGKAAKNSKEPKPDKSPKEASPDKLVKEPNPDKAAKGEAKASRGLAEDGISEERVQSGESDPFAEESRYGFTEDTRSLEELEGEAVIAAEAAAEAARLVTQRRGEFDAAAKAAGLDPAEFTGDAAQWVIAFEQIDFGLLAKDSRLGGEAALQREKLRTNIMLDQVDLLMAKKSLDGSMKLFENEFIPETELEKEKLAYERKRIGLDLKKEDENLFFRYTFPKMAEQFVADFVESLRRLDRVKRTSATRRQSALIDFLNNKMRLLYREESRRRNYVRLANYKIRADTEGLLIYGESGNQNRDWDEQIREGMYAREGMTLFTIPDLTQMAFGLELHESEIDKVSVGQRVKIRVEAFPDEDVDGVVSKVALLPSSASSFFNPEMRLYDVVATVSEVHDWLKPGMTAEIKIIVDDVADALLAPLEALTTRGNETICFLANGERRTVETGLFNDKFAEIKSGLQEGDVIALDPRPFLKSIDDSTDSIELWMPENADKTATAQ